MRPIKDLPCHSDTSIRYRFYQRSLMTRFNSPLGQGNIFPTARMKFFTATTIPLLLAPLLTLAAPADITTTRVLESRGTPPSFMPMDSARKISGIGADLDDIALTVHKFAQIVNHANFDFDPLFITDPKPTFVTFYSATNWGTATGIENIKTNLNARYDPIYQGGTKTPRYIFQFAIDHFNYFDWANVANGRAFPSGNITFTDLSQTTHKCEFHDHLLRRPVGKTPRWQFVSRNLTCVYPTNGGTYPGYGL